jgi:polysaccharide biosynthesis/export protein
MAGPMRRFVLALMLVNGGGAACGGGPTIHYDYAREPDPRKSEYVIGVADELAISVWKNPELSTRAVVRPDGTITMPLIGDLKAAGRTPTQLKDEVTRQLANFIRDEGAVVTIAITAVNSYSFTVSGNVERAGVFSSPKYVTVLEAVQLAGGPNRYASPEKMKLFRAGPDGKMKVIPINYEDLQAGKRLEANLALLPGDQLYVP